jgi:hypothetical protein
MSRSRDVESVGRLLLGILGSNGTARGKSVINMREEGSESINDV